MSFNGNLYESDEGLELTTKAQIHTHDSSSNTALNVGTDGYILSADSTESTGLKYIANTDAGLTMGVQGDIHIRNASANVALPIGSATTGDLLTCDTTLGEKMKWATPSGSAGQELLYDDTLLATTTGTTDIFEMDKSATPLTSTNYSSFLITLYGQTAGTDPYTTDLNFVIDRATSNNYYQQGWYTNASGVRTWNSAMPATTGTMADGTILDGNNKDFYTEIYATFAQRTRDFNIFARTFQYGNGYSAFKQINGWNLLSSANQISYIGIGCSTEGLASGSRCTIWGNKST